MKVSLKWLRQYVAVTLPPEELARRITLATAEVEAVERIGEWSNVTVGAVVNAEPMPGSDHLSLVDVNTGDGVKHVVCGAPNVAAGQMIAYASIGAVLRDASTGELRTLKAAKIRGHESDGMVCSEAELGLSGEHSGILVLPADAPLGVPLAEYLGDVVLHVGSWAHRADLLSMLGVAREVAALTGETVHPPSLDFAADAGSIEGRLQVTIEAPDLCPRYVGGLIEGVTIGPAPVWMQQRLTAAGLRPINNVVDITNYVMLELGQPLHAFDYDQVAEHRVVVRRAVDGERLTTLDGVDRTLSNEMLVIADPSGPIALAGVMGGAGSEVHAETRTILLEAATFHGMNVRKTSTRLGLRSEASSRFEKQLPASLPDLAARRAVQLLVEHAGGKAREGFVDVYPAPQQPVRITLTAERLRRVLGIEIAAAEVVQALTALGFSCAFEKSTQFAVTVPPWRTDVLIPDDVVEEVIRILGFERLPGTMISGRVPEHRPQPHLVLRDRVKDVLAAVGGQEVITYSAVSDELLRKVTALEVPANLQPLRIVNPMSEEHEFLRTTLRGSILETLAENIKLRRPSLFLFETAPIFLPGEPRGVLPEEREMAIGVLSGSRTDRWGSATAESLDFFDAKGVVEALDRSLGAGFEYAAANDPLLIAGRTASISVAGEKIGVVGQVHPDVLARFDLEHDVLLFELDLKALLPHVGGVRRAVPVSRFPAVHEDIALLVDQAVPAAALVESIRRARLLSAAHVFDEYLGERLPPGKKSVAISLTYQASNRTLIDEQVTRARRGILEGLRRQFGAELRS